LNVTTEDLEAYIVAFIKCLEESAAKYLPTEVRPQLLHLAALPARITGYVSSQFGVAIEYVKAADTSIRIIRGSARVEDLLVPAPARCRDTGPTFRVAAQGVGFVGFSLEGAFPFRLMTAEASATFQDVAFMLGGHTKRIEFAEVFGDRSASNWSVGKAESRAKDEVLAALVHVQQARSRQLPIAEYLNRFKDKAVLVLGSYEPEGNVRLEAIASALRAQGYDPVSIKDVPDHPHQDLSQKVVAIGAVARFIVVDDSTKSGHLTEVQLCRSNNWVTVLLRAHGVGASWMTAGASVASNVIRELAYDPEAPDPAIADAVGWAENKLRELEVQFSNTYPWRRPA
jgi:hypothetical protein